MYHNASVPWIRTLTWWIIQSRYTEYLPVYDNTTTLPAGEAIAFSDRGLDADPAKPHLNQGSNTTITRLTPRIGTEIRGLQLSELNDVQKNELALLIAERGVVVFRDQDFKDIGPQRQKEFGRYFGELHVHVCFAVILPSLLLLNGTYIRSTI